MKEIFNFKNTIIGLIVLLIAFFVWSKVSSIISADDPVTIVPTSRDHTLGKSDAKVTVVEFADFQCPACKAFEEVITPVMGEYSDKVKFVFKHFPLTQIHQNAMTAAIIAEAASEQGKFWELKKVLYEKQSEWSSSIEAKVKILSYAETLGLDMDKLKKDVADPKIRERVNADLKEATSLKLPGTPTIIINGVKVNTTAIGTAELFRSYLDKEIAKANGIEMKDSTSTVNTGISTSTSVELSTSSIKIDYNNTESRKVKAN